MTLPRCPGQDMRFWKPEDIFEIRCGHCGQAVEFFKDEPLRVCRLCGKDVRNPRIDLGCAKWCKFAEQCFGEMPGAPQQVGSLCDRLIARMRGVFGDDQRRIDHALAVLEYAETILGTCPGASGLVVRAAAILHDIGIHEAERKHGSSAGRFQEIEGPPIAREILESMDIDAEVIDHVCRIIANHHSARDIDTLEFRIIWDADWLVNIQDEYNTSDEDRTSQLIAKVFKTRKGKAIAERMFLQSLHEKPLRQERNGQ